jgi:hypothetical protein
VTLTFFAQNNNNVAGEEVIVFIDSWPLISLKILLATNHILRIFTHGNPVDFTKGSPNVSKGELLAGEDGKIHEPSIQHSVLNGWNPKC